MEPTDSIASGRPEPVKEKLAEDMKLKQTEEAYPPPVMVEAGADDAAPPGSKPDLNQEPPVTETQDMSGSSSAQTERTKPTGLLGLVREVVELVVVTLVLLIAIRWAFAEARYIPSSSMEPTLQINDRLLVEKVSGHLGKQIQRGDILVFYPPPLEMGGQDLRNDPLTVLGRWTGLPFLPYEPAFIKRVVGLPGEHLRIQAGTGVFINGQLLDETSYIKEPPNYNLNVLGEIGGRATDGSVIRPYGDSAHASDPIMVPPGHLFMMGDNRNNSEDSHVWGFLDEKRVVGRACLLFWRRLTPPKFQQILDE